MIAPPPEVLTVDETAAMMRVDRKTVYAMIQANQIPGVRRLGRVLRIHRPTVVAWLASGQERGSQRR